MSDEKTDTVTVTITRVDALAITLGPLDAALSEEAKGGSPMKVRRAIANALAEKGWWPGA